MGVLEVKRVSPYLVELLIVNLKYKEVSCLNAKQIRKRLKGCEYFCKGMDILKIY